MHSKARAMPSYLRKKNPQPYEIFGGFFEKATFDPRKNTTWK